MTTFGPKEGVLNELCILPTLEELIYTAEKGTVEGKMQACSEIQTARNQGLARIREKGDLPGSQRNLVGEVWAPKGFCMMCFSQCCRTGM